VPPLEPRVPDFYSFSLSVAVPKTAGYLGWNINITLDRHYQLYLSPFGASLGRPMGGKYSASLTGNWIYQSNKPSAAE
jgi:hypothetical protein